MKNFIFDTSSSNQLLIETEHMFRSPGDFWISTPDADMVHRTYKSDLTKSYTIKSWPASEIEWQVSQYLNTKEQDIATLQQYATWQRHYIDFQATYAAFLLGALSEEEFEADSQQYAPNIKDVEPDSLVASIERLSTLLEFELRASELAEFFQVDQSVVNNAMNKANINLHLSLQAEVASPRLIQD